MSEMVERNDEDMLRVKVRNGYVLQIGGDFYQEDEIIATRYKNIKEQKWKVEILGSSNDIPRKSARPEVIVEEKKEVVEEEDIEEEIVDMLPVVGEEEVTKPKTVRITRSKK